MDLGKLKVYALLGWLLWSVPSMALATANICTDRQSVAFLGDARNLHELSYLTELSRGARLVLIGELHGAVKGARAEILKALAGGQADSCVFYELDRHLTIEQHLRKLSAPGFEESFAEFREIHATATAIGASEHTVDGTYPIVYDGSDLNPRDQMMAQKISELFAQGTCRRAFMFVGSDHMIAGEKSRRPLPQLLAATTPIYRVRLQEASDRQWKTLGPDYKSLMAWAGLCPKGGLRLPLPPHPRVFENRFLPASLRLNPFSEDSGYWQNFDATILVTE